MGVLRRVLGVVGAESRMMSCRARWRESAVLADVCAGLGRGLLVSPLQSLGVLAVQARSPELSGLMSGLIAAVWLTNVASASRGRAYGVGFVVGSALGSAAVVWGAR